MVNIYEYMDYRQYLRDRYKEKGKASKSMSLRSFSKAAGLSSWNYLKLIMDGKRNLTSKTIEKFAKALKLSKRDEDFFEVLVFMNQSTDPEEKNRLFAELMTFKRFQSIHKLEFEAYQLLSKWYIAATHELVSLPGFKNDPEWIASHLSPKIKTSEAAEAMKVLKDMGLIEIDQKTGKVLHTKGRLTTPSEVAGMAVFNFHKDILRLALEAVRFKPPKTRDVSGITISLSKEQFETARDMIRDFRRKLHAKLAVDEKGDAVYQINFQIFPLSEVDHE